VADRDSKASANIAAPILKACLQRGLLTRVKGESLLLAPPLIITEEEVDEMLGIVREAIDSVIGKR
jgi:adenosylmethionine-8-amino-7-oxononanoate aminotransferase